MRAALPLALLALACASPPERVWVPDDATLTFEQARARCGAEHISLRQEPGAMETGMLGFIGCMNQYGWYYMPTEPAE